MRKEIGGQVRKTFSGGRTESADIWDVATTEIPPEVGEAPECQWCPICRAARQLRDSGPGIGGHISGAGNAVASAVQDAIGAFDAVLAKAAGTSDRARQDRPRADRPTATRPDTSASASRAADPSPAADTSPAADPGPVADRPAPAITVTPEPIAVPGADSPETAGSAGAAASSVLGSPAREPDAWSLVTDVAADESKTAGADAGAGADAEDGGHGPDDRS